MESERQASRLHAGWIMLAGLGAVLLGYFHVLPPLLKTWLESPEFGHGLLIPFVVGFVLWDTRGRVFGQAFSPSWLGVGLLLVAQAIFVSATLADLEKIKAYSLVMSLLALLMAIGGDKVAKRCVFPLLLLLLAIPLPYLLNKLLTIRLQLVSSDIGVTMIRAMGLPVLQEGNVINMGAFKMLVAEACAGLRYMFPLLSIGLIIGYFFRAPVWAKVVVVVATVPITILMNSFRIAVTGLLIDRFGPEAAEGFLHAFEGWVVFGLALAALIGVIWLVVRLLPGKQRLKDCFHMSSAAHAVSFASWRNLPGPVTAFFVVLLLGSLASAYAYIVVPTVSLERETFARIPLVVDGRGLVPGTLEQEVLDVLKADDYFIGDYTNRGRPPINLYMAYYAAQRDGAVVHSPRDCLPSGGWTIESLAQVDLPYLEGQANRALINNGQESLLVYYWVNQQGRNYADEMKARAALLIGSVTNRRTDASLVRVIAPIAGSVEESEREIRQFIGSLASDLPRFLPQ